MDYPISSRTVSLKEVLLDNKQLIVPAYQRGYEWKDKQLSEFLNSIITGFESARKTFFGTIQLDNKTNSKEIVDGQQRLTTMILMLNILEIVSENGSFSLKGLIDYRNVINANSLLEKVLLYGYESEITIRKGNKDLEIKYSKNKYDLNTKLLFLEFSDYIKDNELNSKEFANKLLTYLLDDVYFVVLETEDIPLPEIVSIFNTINTTGLELDSSDIFKLQYYEYLRHTDNFTENDDCMEMVNDCYNLVDEYNNKTKSKTIPMAYVLDAYKHVISARYELSFERLSLGNDAFFDYIFNNKPKKFSELLDYNKFKSFVEMYIDLFSMIDKAEIECEALKLLSVNLLEDSRYSRYRTLPYISAFFSLDNGIDRETSYIKAIEDTFNCVRYFIVNSVNYDRVIEPVHLNVCNLVLPALYKQEPTNEVIKKVLWKSPYDDSSNQQRFVDRISYDLYENRTRAYVVCELSAVLDELKATKRNKTKTRVMAIREKLFSWDSVKFDLEHIYPQSSFSKLAKDAVPMFNGIGNIIVLDRDINRAIKDLAPHKKILSYSNSKYASAKEIIAEINIDGKWNKDKVQNRLEKQIESLKKVLNGNTKV